MRIATSQYPISTLKGISDWEKNVKKWVYEAVALNAEVLVFPEYGSMEMISFADIEIQKNLKAQVRMMSEHKTDILHFFSNLAKQNKVYILAPSFPMLHEKKIVNRAYFFKPSGEVEYQDKQMMTRFEDEEWGVQSGEKKLTIFETPMGKLGVAICFDIEFPHIARELCAQGVKVILTPSCTEALKGLNRVHIGARARALENQCYVVVAQTVGEAPWSEAVDKNQGLAAVYGPPDLGFPDDGIVAQGTLNKPMWVHANLDLKKVDDVREKGTVFNYKLFHKT